MKIRLISVHLLFSLFCWFPVALWAASTLEPPKVVVSIKPLQALVAGVMAGVEEPQLLLPPGANPHSHALRPSEARRLSKADLVFWVGPELEGFLGTVLMRLMSQEQHIAVSRLPGVRHLNSRSPGIWLNTPELRDHNHRHDHHSSSMMDPHIWLDPQNALAMVDGIAAALSHRYPHLAQRFEQNRIKQVHELQVLHDQLIRRMKQVRTKPFLVYHDAFQYFEKRYGLKGVGSVTLHPDQPPSARRIAKIRKNITPLGIVCLFTEPSFQPRIISTLLEDKSVRTVQLDILGSGSAFSDVNFYVRLMEQLAAAVESCLKF